MKILLDENLPVKLKYRFLDVGITALTVREMNWLGTQNGFLLQLMLENGFTHFITYDNNIAFQQHFRDYPIAVIVLVARNNTYETIMEFFTAITESIKGTASGVQVVIHSTNK